MTTPTQQTKGGLVKELHGDLARKCRALVSKLEQIWRSHGQPQQAQAMRAGAAERVMDDDILDVDSRTRTQQPRPHKSLDTATAAMAKLEIETPPQKLELTDLISIAREQKATLDDNLHMLCTEPVVLAHVVNECFFSRPELVADEGGCILPAYTDKHTSAAVVEAVHNSIKSPAIWSYMTRLLELLGDTTDKSRQAVILQEIANLCHLEYTRAQALFRRQISTGTGMKYFQRVYTDAYDYGNACVSINAKPEQLLAQGDVQLSYALRLCQSETNASKAVTWIKELDQFHRSHPEMREVLFEREVDALADLAVIVSFIHSLSPAVSLPAHNRIKGPALVSQLESEINELRSRIDLGDFVIPIDNLLEPGMAVGALDALDRFIVEKTGTPLGLLYQGVIDQSILLLQEQIQAQVEKRPEAEHVPPTHEGHAHEVLYRCHRRPKEKTRRSHPAACEDLVFALSSSASEDSTTEEEQEAAPPRHRVKPFNSRGLLDAPCPLLRPGGAPQIGPLDRLRGRHGGRGLRGAAQARLHLHLHSRTSAAPGRRGH
ncbi:hypothetical protein GGR56DRAFT_511374 [Xylariaceae sp. FL0804]|nr:hypothetical protein GGR56DRAFT_511374 [Xylariaceae sp. FL0804]